MFPLVHHYINTCLNPVLHPYTVYGGLFPDLASGTGYDRNTAHEIGQSFYAWCKNNAPEGLPLARGIICHGNKPAGVDYYADEYWPGKDRGWCFQQGAYWLPKVKNATGLPDEMLWWKSHNFIEIALEYLLIQKYSAINRGLINALEDKNAAKDVSKILSRFTGIEAKSFTAVYQKAAGIFALDPVTPLHLAEKQADAFRLRHNILTADVNAMAELIIAISLDLKDCYEDYLALVEKKVGQALANYPA